MDPQRIARVTGVLFVLTFITAIAGLALYGPVLNDPEYILSGDADGQIKLAALLEVLLVVTNIGTAVVLYPIVKRQNEAVAIGYVTARVMECAVIMVGIFSLLSIVTLRQDLAGSAGADAASLLTTGRSLVAIHDWTFLFGPGLIVGFGNGMLLGYLMYRSGLVPRRMAMLGLVGGPLLIASAFAITFGAYENGSTGAFAAALPEILWEGSLGIYLIVKGFKPSAITSPETHRVEMDAALSAA